MGINKAELFGPNQLAGPPGNGWFPSQKSNLQTALRRERCFTQQSKLNKVSHFEMSGTQEQTAALLLGPSGN